MITNNDIRRFLDLPTVEREFEIDQVDALGVHEHTLMFVNKLDIDLKIIGHSQDCVFLLDDSYPDIQADNVDIIRISNPKYKFCLIQKHFGLRSALQREYQMDKLYHNASCREILSGDNVEVYPGARVGITDFSPVQGDSRDELVEFPQLGGVKLGNNVSIRYYTIIGKGTFGYTTIGDNTMIDSGCQIGHNCIIGKACIIAAGVIIGGSTTIGDNTTIGIGAKIRNGIKIGKNVSIGMGSVVIKDVPDNAVVVGNPARIINHKPIFDEKGLV